MVAALQDHAEIAAAALAALAETGTATTSTDNDGSNKIPAKDASTNSPKEPASKEATLNADSSKNASGVEHAPKDNVASKGGNGTTTKNMLDASESCADTRFAVLENVDASLPGTNATRIPGSSDDDEGGVEHAVGLEIC